MHRRPRPAPLRLVMMASFFVVAGNGPAGCATRVAQPPVVAGAGEAQAACAVVQGGRVHCWLKDVPYWVPGVDDAMSVAVYEPWGCAVRKAGLVSCWRHSADFGKERVFVDSVRLDRPSRVVVTGNAACAVLGNRRVTCWKLSSSEDKPLEPAPVAFYGEVADLALYFADSVHLRPDGHVVAPAFPVDPQVASVAQVALGDHFACLRTTQGRVSCWGSNWMGRLGDGTWNSHDEASAVKGVSDVTEISAGMGHACARHTDGSVSCWGSNQFGQVGVPSKGLGDNRPTPVRVPDVRALSLSATGNGTCVVTTARELVCWGFRHGPRRMELSAPTPPHP